jgi:hypothetical protein
MNSKYIGGDFRKLLIKIAHSYGAKINFRHLEGKGGEYDYENKKIIIGLFFKHKKKWYAETLCHELGHFLHHKRKNTIFPKDYGEATLKIAWQMEMVADNIGKRLFKKHFRHMGKYRRAYATKGQRGYKEDRDFVRENILK